MRNRLMLVTVLLALLGILLLVACSLDDDLAQITPTPTKTPRPLFTATRTPTALPPASDTPLPSPTRVPPTDAPVLAITPLPPTETHLPTEPVVTPTEAAEQPTSTLAPPTNTPKPAATKTPAPPTNTPKPQVDFRIIDLYAFEDGSLTSTGFRNVYFATLDASGAPIDGIILQETNNQPTEELVSGDKGPGKAEFTLWDKAYKFKIVGNAEGQTFSSEETHMISILPDFAVWDDLIHGGICPDEETCRSMGKMHYSYILTYQRTW